MTRLGTLILAMTSTLMAALPAWATPEGAGKPIDAGHHFQTPVTPVMEDIVWLDDFLHGVVGIPISVFVVGLLAYVVIKFNRKANPEPSTVTHNTPLEVAWTLVPVLILIVIAIPSVQLLFLQFRKRLMK